MRHSNKKDKIACKICFSKTEEVFNAQILNKYNIQYYQCPNCLFIQTENEYWLKEAYESPINLSDTGGVTRNIMLAFKSSLIIHLLFDRKGKFLDYAGGYGLLTRLMRDIGFDFYWYDLHTKNEFARGFEGKLKDKYEVLTIFEAFEHFRNPHEELKKIFKLSDTIIFTTTLLPKPTPSPQDWWYYGLEHGQHIGLYSKETFEYLAKKYGYGYYTDGRYFHILTKKKLSKTSFKFSSSFLALSLLPFVLTINKSKTLSDNKNLSRNS